MKIFLDDERVPVKYEEWVTVRNFGEFRRLMLRAGSAVTDLSFDHDLGLGELHDGMTCVHFLVDLAMDEPEMVSGLTKIMFHTANIGGMKNMRGLIESAQKHDILSGVELVDYSCLFHSDHAMMPKDFDERTRDLKGNK